MEFDLPGLKTAGSATLFLFDITEERKRLLPFLILPG